MISKRKKAKWRPSRGREKHRKGKDHSWTRAKRGSHYHRRVKRDKKKGNFFLERKGGRGSFGKRKGRPRVKATMSRRISSSLREGRRGMRFVRVRKKTDPEKKKKKRKEAKSRAM